MPKTWHPIEAQSKIFSRVQAQGAQAQKKSKQTQPKHLTYQNDTVSYLPCSVVFRLW